MTERSIDLTPALARLAGDRLLLIEMAQFFIADAPELLQTIQAGVDSGDLEQVAIAAHSLKGQASTFDAFPCMDHAREIERLARCKHLEEIKPRLMPIREALDQVIAALRQELNLGESKSIEPH